MMLMLILSEKVKKKKICMSTSLSDLCAPFYQYFTFQTGHLLRFLPGIAAAAAAFTESKTHRASFQNSKRKTILW